MKYLLSLFLLIVGAASVFGQPIQRQYYTTNADPVLSPAGSNAVYVLSTNTAALSVVSNISYSLATNSTALNLYSNVSIILSTNSPALNVVSNIATIISTNSVNSNRRIPMVTDYGAVGDGSTDDSAAFWRCATNGFIGIPGTNKNYVVSNLTLYANTTIRGYGGTLIRKSGATGSFIKANTGVRISASGLRIDGLSTAAKNVTQGGTTNASLPYDNSAALDIYSQGGNFINDVEVKNWSGVAFRVGGLDNITTRGNMTRITSCMVSNVTIGFYAVDSNQGEYMLFNDNRVKGCYAGVINSCANVNYVGNVFNDNYQAFLFWPGNSRAHALVVGNIINHSTLAAFFFRDCVLNSSYAWVEGNVMLGEADIYFVNSTGQTFKNNNLNTVTIFPSTANTTNYFIGNKHDQTGPAIGSGSGVIRLNGNTKADGHLWANDVGFDVYDNSFVFNNATNPSLATAVWVSDSNGKLKKATLSGLTFDGTTLTAEGGPGSVTSPIEYDDSTAFISWTGGATGDDSSFNIDVASGSGGGVTHAFSSGTGGSTSMMSPSGGSTFQLFNSGDIGLSGENASITVNGLSVSVDSASVITSDGTTVTFPQSISSTFGSVGIVIGSTSSWENTTGHQVTVYISGGTSVEIQDAATATLVTLGSAANKTAVLQPGWFLVGTGVAGTAVAF